MHLILTGATGQVGTAVLHHILSLPPTSPLAQKISHLSIISRRAEIPLLAHPECPKQNTITKVEVLQHNDFKDYEKNGLLEKLKSNPDNTKVGVVWALGVSSAIVSAEKEYDDVTRVFPTEAAKAFATGLNANQVNFVYVSGEGATPKPGFTTPMYGRIKGQAEIDLLKLMQNPPCNKVLKCFAARPGGIDSGAEPSQKLVDELCHRNDGGTGGQFRNQMGMKVLERLLMPVFRTGVYKSMHSPTSELARVLVDLATGDGDALQIKGVEADGRVIPNIALRRLGESVAS